ncbi:expressed unknown protein [Seminavis robusta]|uniref:Uncharacterized protein n=1 Tax=Seminavis robusta TaxID=568900 RepID=A0A9N8H253_9STRA|nr:expressed unknown protein [Seminavis robusta]|eukprot:Sro30_g019390.1 n/a (219) ;mRNA; r:10298-10954
MGQQVSKTFCYSSSVDGTSKLSKPSRGALRAAASRSFSDDFSSKSTVSSEDSLPQQPSPEVAVASASAFFGASSANDQLGTKAPFSDSGSPLDSRQDDSLPPPPHSQSPFLVIPNTRPPTNPVKCPPAPRRDLSHASGDLEEWHEDDVQHLTRLYEQRTWQMFMLITEARKQQRYQGRGYHNGGITAGETVSNPDETRQDASASELSPNHEMIFSCDL